MGTLPSALRSKGLEREGDENYKVATCSMQGWRKDMEDAHVVKLQLPSHPNTALFGVFDGHAGPSAAEFMRKQLWKKLDALDDFTDPLIDAHLIRIVEELDKSFMEAPTHIKNNGSTSCFLVVTTNPQKLKEGAEDAFTIKVASTGDSRAYWGDNNSFKCLTDDHKPTRPDERERIIKAGGHVTNDRVDGQLAVSRAIGDWRFKNLPNLPYGSQKVIGTPQITTQYASPGKDQWAFICCDGLVEQWENDQMIGALRKSLEGQADMAHGLTDLFEMVLDDGSQDNMSSVLIKFADGRGYGSDKGPRRSFIPGPLFTHRTSKVFCQAYFKFALRYKVEDTPELRIAAYKEDVRLINLSETSVSKQQVNKRIATILQSIRHLEKQIKGRDASRKAAEKAAAAARNGPATETPGKENTNLRIMVTPPTSQPESELCSPERKPLQPEENSSSSKTLPTSTATTTVQVERSPPKATHDNHAQDDKSLTSPPAEQSTSNSSTNPTQNSQSSEGDPPPAADENTPKLQNGGLKRKLGDTTCIGVEEVSPTKRLKLSSGVQ